jgi:hypothetical protein
MGRISLDLPDVLLNAAKSKAAEGGYDSIESYLTALLESEVAVSDEALEAMLIERLDDPRPNIEATDDFWRDLKAKVRSEIDRKGRAAS